ncbi:hypothetical protein [Pantoea sp. GbtcB22]|uniref:hypothetical protein n=1 Tax=Pantoea sp. GbtcB22 TaxID=2824767 RepID=UPI001C2F5BFE|nr:hypothetical protein [Pantoea sp. GbtcB22]
MDSLIYALTKDFGSLPIEIQSYANGLINSPPTNSDMNAYAQILAESGMNGLTASFDTGWPYTTVTPKFSGILSETVERNYGFINAYGPINIVNLTTQLTVYLDQNVMMVFFQDEVGVVVGSFIAPGLITLQTGSRFMSGIKAKWSKSCT